MRHVERHTYIFNYDVEKVHFFDLQDELKLFRKAWPNAIVNGDLMGEVTIAYEAFSQCKYVAENAALNFRENINRHDWWEEI